MGKGKVPKAAWDKVRDAARRIRDLEAAASRALEDAGDTAAHRAGLTQKCLALEALPGEVAASMAGTTTDGAAAFAAGLEDFARRAGMALSLESIFFMGALLYPEDYRDGDANDLERFLDRFEAV